MKRLGGGETHFCTVPLKRAMHLGPVLCLGGASCGARLYMTAGQPDSTHLKAQTL